MDDSGFSSLPTPKARDSQAEGYEAGLRRSQPQVGTIVKGLVERDPRVTEDNLFRTPSVTDSTGGSISEVQARERGRMVETADQAAQLAFENGLKVSESIALSLLPTPNTMEHREIKTPEQIAALKAKSPGGYANLRETVVNDLLPTPIVRDYKDGSAAQTRDGKVSTDTVARAIFNSGEILLPTTTASDWKGPNNSGSGSASTNSISTVADNLPSLSWGKFEPAILRWEAILGRPAPAPTKPDGKDGAHRLNSEFTEWMMGLPAGWITGVGLTRNEELKACGNGVVPQQAELAIRLMLGEDLEKFNG